MSPDELDALLSVLAKHGVEEYYTAELRVKLKSANVHPLSRLPGITEPLVAQEPYDPPSLTGRDALGLPERKVKPRE